MSSTFILKTLAFSVLSCAIGCSNGLDAGVLGTVDGAAGTLTDRDGSGDAEPSQTAMPEPSDESNHTDPGETADPTCEVVDTSPTPIVPRMLILSDRSASMSDTIGASSCPPCFQSRWAASVSAVQSVTRDLEDAIAFGLMLFPSTVDGPMNDDNACVAGEVSVQPGPGHAQAIGNALDAADPGGATPTAGALRAARTELVDLSPPESTPAYVLLVTDGEPTCEDSVAGAIKPDATYAALDALLEEGVPTYVIGHGIGGLFSGAAEDTMQQMAQHGGTDHFYPAEDEAELVSTLRDITGSLIACEYELQMDPPRGDDYIQVTVDGVDVAPGADGWTREGLSIRIGGATCEKLQDGNDHALSIEVKCEKVLLL